MSAWWALILSAPSIMTILPSTFLPFSHNFFLLFMFSLSLPFFSFRLHSSYWKQINVSVLISFKLSSDFLIKNSNYLLIWHFCWSHICRSNAVAFPHPHLLSFGIFLSPSQRKLSIFLQAPHPNHLHSTIALNIKVIRKYLFGICHLCLLFCFLWFPQRKKKKNSTWPYSHLICSIPCCQHTREFLILKTDCQYTADTFI